MTSRIITDPKKLRRDQVQRPSRVDLYAVALSTYDVAFDLARSVRRSQSHSPRFREFVAASLQAAANKMLVIKRIGPNYLPEARSIYRDLTEVIVDTFWVASHLDTALREAEQLAKQFFLSSAKQFVEQEGDPGDAFENDVFLSEHVTRDDWLRMMADAERELEGVNMPDNWRMLPSNRNADRKWGARCKRAARLAEKMLNLKFAPYHRNLKMLSGYVHWDAPQIREMDDGLRDAFFDRLLNNAIGLVHDTMTVACELFCVPLPTDVILLRQGIVYMST